MAIKTSWQIRKRAKVCSETNVEFEDGESFYTAIFENMEEDNAFIRKDFSEATWAELSKDFDPKPFSFWRTKYEAPVIETDDPIVKKQTAESLLLSLMEEDKEQTESARFILAVMLERDKVLKEIDTKDTDEAKFRIYEHRRSGDVLIIRDPQLKLDQVDTVQAEVIALLEGGEASASGDQAESLDGPPSTDSSNDEGQGDGDAGAVEVTSEPAAEDQQAEPDDGELAELDPEVEAEQGDEDSAAEVPASEHVSEAEPVDEPEDEDQSKA